MESRPDSKPKPQRKTLFETLLNRGGGHPLQKSKTPTLQLGNYDDDDSDDDDDGE